MLRYRSRTLGCRNHSQHFQTLVLSTDIIDARKKDLVFRYMSRARIDSMGTMGAQHRLFFGWNTPFSLAGSGFSFTWESRDLRYSHYKADRKGIAGHPGTVVDTNLC